MLLETKIEVAQWIKTTLQKIGELFPWLMTNMEAPLIIPQQQPQQFLGRAVVPAFFAVTLYSHIKLMYNVFWKKLTANIHKENKPRVEVLSKNVCHLSIIILNVYKYADF